jgi:hypothetical protein
VVEEGQEPRGYLIYSTCISSLNEEIHHHFLHGIEAAIFHVRRKKKEK